MACNDTQQWASASTLLVLHTTIMFFTKSRGPSPVGTNQAHPPSRIKILHHTQYTIEHLWLSLGFSFNYVLAVFFLFQGGSVIVCRGKREN